MRVNFDITQSLLELSELEITAPENVGVTLLSSSMIDERRKVLQRGLNLEDAAQSLLNFIKENGRKITGDKASISSDTALDLSLTDTQSAISGISELDGISMGSFHINGVDFQIDTSSESLEDIIDKINSADAGVKASFDFSEGQLIIESQRDKPLFLMNGSSNFFSATNLKDGFIASEASINKKEFLESDSVQLRFSRFTGRFNRLMSVDFETARLDAFKSNVNNLLRSGVQNNFGEVFTNGTIRLGSNVELTINSEHTKFTKTKIGFTTNDTPSEFFSFLESTNGVLSALASFSGEESEKLKENIRSSSSTGLIIQKNL
ncbi:MAG: hypothetical protein NE327_21880 [Lentisphaeraceae bacterium]|nr:hypothetical protein [Lentisphaeraceae bacterium]